MAEPHTSLIIVVDTSITGARVRRPKPLTGTIGGGGGSTGGGHGPVFEPGHDRLQGHVEANERDKDRR